jgi:hypothetical protein
MEKIRIRDKHPGSATLLNNMSRDYIRLKPVWQGISWWRTMDAAACASSARAGSSSRSSGRENRGLLRPRVANPDPYPDPHGSALI